MSQIPSAGTLAARRAQQRYDRCPVCKVADVSGTHVDLCETRERYWQEAAKRIDEAAIPGATGHDLWAHLFTRLHNPITATAVAALVIDLGWRPVVGSDPRRLWTATETHPEPTDPRRSTT